MTKRMLIDATHPEETRVVALNGNRLEEFDFETSTKKQLKGNIYLAKVTRVEPSLQAAFVEFGGNRHGFLAFSEIHPDYYQIPVADRQALLREHEEELAAEAAAEDADEAESEGAPAPDKDAIAEEAVADNGGDDTAEAVEAIAEDGAADQIEEDSAAPETDETTEPKGEAGDEAGDEAEVESETEAGTEAKAAPAQSVEELGGEDDAEVHQAERRRVRNKRQRYKIQEVIKRRQILLIQVVKEERGNKGAALTTYLSLAGRYCVLMPNTAKGGGISRKITSAGDRKRLKSLISALEIPDGTAVILRTAAVERSKAELKRDFEFLMRSWDLVRERTLTSIAPTLVYEEANLIKRSIRDLYTKDIDEVIVDGEEGYKIAKEFMRMLMPSHAKKVQPYKDPEIPLYNRYQVDAQLDAMHSPNVQLKSGGYIVINPTEALISIDVNSGRSTKERNIEETAYKTNLEAADEIARQLKLRDLAGLIVIDFIDMAENRNQHTVERRLKEAMRNDRARIQIGRISAFGLMELSRQRLRPSLVEANTHPCPYCEGTGLIRSTESAALYILRAIEEEGIRRRSSEVSVTVAVDVALYILNQKRGMLQAIENRYDFRVLVSGDNNLIPPDYNLERVEGRTDEAIKSDAKIAAPAPLDQAAPNDAEDATAEPVDATEHGEGEGDERSPRRPRRRRPRRRRGKDDQAEDTPSAAGAEGEEAPVEAKTDQAESNGEPGSEENGVSDEEKPKRRRRGRRGGRRRGRPREEEQAATDAENGTATDAGGTPEQEAPSEAVVEAEPAPEPAVATNNNGNGAVNDSTESIQPEIAPEIIAEPEVAATSDEPKRKGWWNRFNS
jgi:ribonuclease E